MTRDRFSGDLARVLKESDKHESITEARGVDMVALYIGDGYLAGASTSDRAYSISYWPSDMWDGDDWELAELNNVPPELAQQLEDQGTSDQFFSDGYEAANAAADYAGDSIDSAYMEACSAHSKKRKKKPMGETKGGRRPGDGPPDAGRYRKSGKVRGVEGLQVGDLLIQPNSFGPGENLVKVTQKPEDDMAYGLFVDPDDPDTPRTYGDREFVIYDSGAKAMYYAESKSVQEMGDLPGERGSLERTLAGMLRDFSMSSGSSRGHLLKAIRNITRQIGRASAEGIAQQMGVVLPESIQQEAAKPLDAERVAKLRQYQGKFIEALNLDVKIGGPDKVREALQQQIAAALTAKIGADVMKGLTVEVPRGGYWAEIDDRVEELNGAGTGLSTYLADYTVSNGESIVVEGNADGSGIGWVNPGDDAWTYQLSALAVFVKYVGEGI